RSPAPTPTPAPHGATAPTRQLLRDAAADAPVEEVGKLLRDKKVTESYAAMEKLTWEQARDVLARFQAEAVKAYGNDEMGKATEILVRKGGRLDLALDWMFDEGTNWDLLKTTISKCTNENFRKMIYTQKYRDLFVGELGNKEM